MSMSNVAIKNVAVCALLAGVSATFSINSQAADASAPVEVQGAWARQSVPGQSGTGAFMNLTAPTDMRLVGASSPVAGVAQIHEMQRVGDVMKMREVKGGIALPAHQTVALKSGGFHVMLMDLKNPLEAGTRVPVVLLFQDATGAKSTVDLDVPVGMTAAAAGVASNSSTAPAAPK